MIIARRIALGGRGVYESPCAMQGLEPKRLASRLLCYPRLVQRKDALVSCSYSQVGLARACFAFSYSAETRNSMICLFCMMLDWKH